MTELTKEQQTELEAAAFRRLVAHPARAQRRSEHRPDESSQASAATVCPTGIAKAAEEAGLPVTKDGSREMRLRHVL